MLFRVSGKFADRHTFSINDVEAEGPKEAMAEVLGHTAIKNSDHGEVTMIVVRKRSGKNSKIRISDKPSAERKGGGRKKKGSTPAPAATSGRR